MTEKTDPTYTLEIEETGPDDLMQYRWALKRFAGPGRVSGQIASGFTDTRWGARHQAKRAARKDRAQLREGRYRQEVTL